MRPDAGLDSSMKLRVGIIAAPYSSAIELPVEQEITRLKSYNSTLISHNIYTPLTLI